jgi:cation-transporting ATPase E
LLIDELKALFKRGNKAPKTVRTEVPVFRAKASYGLTAAQVSERFDAGWANTPVEPPGKTVGQIVSDNVFTYFNMIFMILALCVIAVGSWQNLMFMFVVIVNTVIGIAQELKAKITLDKLILLSEPNCTVIRSGREQTIAVSDAVRDDIVLFNAGNEIFADAVVVEGSCAANEALITGEAHDEEKKSRRQPALGKFFGCGKLFGKAHSRWRRFLCITADNQGQRTKAAPGIRDDALARKAGKSNRHSYHSPRTAHGL